MSSLEITNAHKNYGAVEVLKDICLDVSSGEFVVFVGPSGCGKSTLLRMIAGLEEISGGEIRLDGQVINDTDPARRGVAMVFQSYALYPHMTVAENMGFTLKLSRAPKREITEKVDQAARILQLEKLLDRKPGQLSGGQKQRVAIGRAIVREPKVFLFDEPLSNLDAELRIQMRAELALLHKRLGSTMIYVTHDQVEAMTLADKMVVMNGGVIQQVGRPLDLYDDPDNMFVAGFVGTPRMNFLEAEVAGLNAGTVEARLSGSDSGLRFAHGGAGLSVGQKVTLGIRPEHIALSDHGGSATFPLSIGFVEELGESTCVHGEIPGGARVTVLSHGARFADDRQVHTCFDPAKVLVFDQQGRRVRSG
ncbi:ABC transporter ATP-binding protein [Paracoccus methylarcula]|uniref:Sn-glycerol-3-phosphate ABC transporter ATP-binding protein UgpC n=1 Tax=Paracoccus methylarcula TaxID=72022 RepID=A0A3R7PP22_9RHOB|nr:sn-glycerol-3-phosphate ABC transporter ATP-binding protein UgpC [Paracoccus methylarcula]RNF33892.1 sn-glycerol-3-phosphate ABC transporter ATP-binding protein UgpC [Paracoccus methylarcula]